MCVFFSISWHLKHSAGQMAHGSSDRIITRPGDSLSKLAWTHGYRNVTSFAGAVHFRGNLNRLPVGLVLELPRGTSTAQYASRSTHPPLVTTVATSGSSQSQRERLGFLAALTSAFVAVAIARRHNKPLAPTIQTPRRSVVALDRLDAVFAKAAEKKAA